MRKWVHLEQQVMKAAREAKGWSYETAAREIHVSSKTYERYEKAGRVPVDLLFTVANALDIQIERAERQTVELPAESATDDRLARVEALLAEVHSLAQAILDELRAGREAPSESVSTSA